MPPDTAYAALEERVLARDQKGASEIYYGLVKSGRPLPEMLREAVRIHGPYTHVPYHERIDDGYVNFVNNDHCLLSARAALQLSKMVPAAAAGLPMAQTIWYIPTGLDIWNQKIAKAPGHYARGFQMPDGPPPAPIVHWPDQEPLALDGSLKERLGQWMTLVHRGQVVDAYRVFLGLMANPSERRAALAELVFAGLIDVQDRSFQNRSYTTGHKSFRARATVELGDAIGWDLAHDVLYAGALDIAVGPRWYSLYEAASNAVMVYLVGQTLHAVPYGGATELERAILANNKAPLTKPESDALLDVILHQPEPGYLEQVTALLKAGKDPRSILDAIQVGCAENVLGTHNDLNFSLPQHCYEYCNTLGWFWDTFDHPQRIKLLYLAASYLNQAAHHQRLTGDLLPRAHREAGERQRPRCRADGRRGRGRDDRARRAQGGRLDAGLSRERPRHGAAGAGARPGLLAARQRSAQPGDRALHAGGLRQEPQSRPRPPAARRRPAHGAAPQVRRPARLQPPLRPGAGDRRAALTPREVESMIRSLL